MAINCPICGESFEDGRGLHGHLRFKEDLSGEELGKTFEEAKDESTREEDSILEEVKRVALHHGISPLEVVKKIRRPMSGGSPWADLDLEGGLIFSSEEQKVAKEMLSELEDRLEKEKEEAGEKLNSVLEKDIKQRA